MAQLSLTEAHVLKSFLDDKLGEIALRAFFTHKANELQAKCLAEVLNYNTQSAQEYAFKANAYAEAFNELRMFSKDQFKS